MTEILTDPHEYATQAIKRNIKRNKYIQGGKILLLGMSQLGGSAIWSFTRHDLVGFGTMVAGYSVFLAAERWNKTKRKTYTTIQEETRREITPQIQELQNIRNKAIDIPFKVK